MKRGSFLPKGRISGTDDALVSGRDAAIAPRRRTSATRDPYIDEIRSLGVPIYDESASRADLGRLGV